MELNLKNEFNVKLESHQDQVFYSPDICPIDYSLCYPYYFPINQESIK